MEDRFEVYQDVAGEWRLRLRTANGEILSVAESFRWKWMAKRACKGIARNAASAPIEDLTGA